MKRILMSFSLVFVFELVAAVLTRVLLFRFVDPRAQVSAHLVRKRCGKLTVAPPMCRISWVSSDSNYKYGVLVG